MATVPPSATPKTNNAILAFIKDIPLQSASKILLRPAYRIARVIGQCEKARRWGGTQSASAKIESHARA
jgi:hypothetical protein